MHNSARQDIGDQGFVFSAVAAALLDRHGVITQWSDSAARLLGLSATETAGRRFAELVARPQAADQAVAEPAGPEIGADAGRVLLRSAGGTPVPVDLYPLPLTGGIEQTLLLFAPARAADEWGYGVSLIRALLAQREFGLVLHEPDLRVAMTNVDEKLFGGTGIAPGERVLDVAHVPDARDVERTLRRVLERGDGSSSSEQRMRSARRPGREWFLSWSALRLTDAQGTPTGVAAVVHDVSEQVQARRHRDLMQQAAARIGLSLSPQRTAQELAEVVVDGFGDLATVDLAGAVLLGEEPALTQGGETALVRAAVATAAGGWPPGLLGPGEEYPVLPGSASLDRLQKGEVLRLTREEAALALGDGAVADLLVPREANDLVVAPLWARGLLLGTVTAWRTGDTPAYGDADVSLLSEVASRAALSIDNGRRYTRERAAAIALQRSLLPQAQVTTSAAETVGIYRPAGGGSGVSGDWFDTISLSSMRTAFVVGDVVGHGLSAAATMGRLRTAVQAFADLELDPDEVLARLEDLVQRLAAEAPPERADTVGATCLYAVYDATTGECTAASAGHPPPVLSRPGGGGADGGGGEGSEGEGGEGEGGGEVVALEPGPPLGAGGAPYPSVTFSVPPDGVLALYTDGVFELDRYSGEGPAAVAEELGARMREDEPLSEIGASMLDQPRSAPPRDDCALLLVRPRPADRAHIATWQLEPRLEVVAQARSLVMRQLHEWHHDELAFTTELVVSELVTNAVRYGSGQIEVRLILDRDRALILEVADASNTQPRLRRAADTDEGGRGLFIVAQCTTRWGCRYRAEGKTIWTEQPLG